MWDPYDSIVNFEVPVLPATIQLSFKNSYEKKETNNKEDVY